MKICELKTRLNNGQEVWSYQREMEFLVRQFDKYDDDNKSFLVRSPLGKLYEFSMTKMSEDELITFIIEGNAEGEEFESSFGSIFDENPHS